MTLRTREPAAAVEAGGEQLSDAPGKAGSDSSAEALFKEARRRRRRLRRWLVVLAVLVAVIAAAVGLIASIGGAPPRRAGGGAHAADGGTSAPTAGHFTVRGTGIGPAYFGQQESAAIPSLEQVLGSLRDAAPTPSNNCTIDSYLHWPTMTAYFDNQLFVGYSTGSLDGGPGYRDIPNVNTVAGLRIGDTLVQARRLYRSGLRTSLAQGGSWFATTPTGTLAGILTNEVNEHTPAPRIAEITAGSVGCPAASP
jgi:hypothetical protein